VFLLLHLYCSSGSLIASSEVQMCARSSATLEPMFGTGKHCSKKFVVSLAVRSGQVSLHQSNKLLCALFFFVQTAFSLHYSYFTIANIILAAERIRSYLRKH